MTLAAATLPVLAPDDPEIPFHEFALLWPPMPPPEFANLERDIAAHGVRSPILMYDEDGIRSVLDGIHRYQAARNVGVVCPYTVFVGSRLEALAISNSLNDRRRHLDTDERLVVAAREQLAAEAEAGPGDKQSLPTTAEVAASLGVSKRHYQRAKAVVRKRQGLPTPPSGPLVTAKSSTGRRDVPAFLRDQPEKTSLDDLARLVRRLKELPLPGHQRADPDEYCAVFLSQIVRALDSLLYAELVDAEPLPPYLRPVAERAHRAAMKIAADLPAQVKRPPRGVQDCQAKRCRGDGRIPPSMQAEFRVFCEKCLY